MPDPIVQDAHPAVSSTATDPTPLAAPDSLDTMSETELHAWRLTGDDPRTKAPTSDAASSAAAADAVQPVSTETSPQAASEPADLKPKTQARIDQVLAERAKERERADRAESRLRDLEARQQRPDVRQAASSPAPAAPTALVKPDPETFPYGTADAGYLEALTDYKVAATLETQRQQWEQGQREARQRDDSQRVIRSFEEKAAAARSAHPDFDAVALHAPTDIPPGSPTDLWVLEDEAGAELLYHLQQPANAAERKRILALGPREQLKELVRLGDRLTTPASASRSTHAPPPPPTLSTRATPGDPVDRALAGGTDDEATGAYMRAQNARDLARLKR